MISRSEQCTGRGIDECRSEQFSVQLAHGGPWFEAMTRAQLANVSCRSAATAPLQPFDGNQTPAWLIALRVGRAALTGLSFGHVTDG